MKPYLAIFLLFFTYQLSFCQKKSDNNLNLGVEFATPIVIGSYSKKAKTASVARINLQDSLQKDTLIPGAVPLSEDHPLFDECFVEIDNSISFRDIGKRAKFCIKRGIDPLTGLHLYVDERGLWRYENDVVNVRHFGAKGDGETDDTEAIKIALRYTCNDITRNGRSLYFPKGVYRTSEAIRGECDGLIIYGDRDATVIKPLEEWSGFPEERGVIGAYGSLNDRINGVIIRDLKVDGSKFFFPDTLQNGVVLGHSVNSKIENVHVIGIENYGIWIRESEDGAIISNYVDGSEEGIEVSQNVDGCKVIGNTVIANETTINMILLYGNATNLQVDNNRLEGKANGIFVSDSFGGCKNLSMTNNIINVANTDVGSVRYCYFLEINSFDEEEVFKIRGGIATAKDGGVIVIRPNVKNVEIEGVTMNSQSGFGIWALTAESIIIANNKMKTEKGIDTFDSNDINISGNVLEHTGNGKVGSRFSSNMIINSNIIKSADVVVGGDSFVSNNTYFPNGNFNIILENENNIMQGNICKGERTIHVFGNNSIIHGNIIDRGIINDAGINNSIQGNLRN